ncbi:hypothetical protein RESH_05257 [Rhodopirellula europaea SH398]|uniref:Uncharacterized protein n=1 Tax=Rhodopirellula europaea SH398 TaxID=1263868 RepID=M5RY40_9BACT|nr:hypothetical protein RESH_05257 [Rhodopirellula europaea SH398]
MNVGYSHGLTDHQLQVMLDRMKRRGLIAISSEADDAESSVTLTPAGGDQWSLERAPVWDRFIFENGSLSGERLTVVAANESMVVATSVRELPLASRFRQDRLVCGVVFPCH